MQVELKRFNNGKIVCFILHCNFVKFNERFETIFLFKVHILDDKDIE